MSNVARLFWIVPFFLFFAGYYGISWLLSSETINTPNLAGKRLQDVVALLTPYQLTLKILDEIEDATLPEGTVIRQKPEADQKIKLYQSVGIVISRHPPAVKAPHFMGLFHKECMSKAGNDRLRLKVYWCESICPKNSCVAQYPAPGDPLPDRTVIIYLSKGQTALRIVPHFVGRELNEVCEFLKDQGIPMNVEPSEIDNHVVYRIVAQKPHFGALIDLDRNPSIQVSIAPEDNFFPFINQSLE